MIRLSRPIFRKEDSPFCYKRRKSGHGFNIITQLFGENIVPFYKQLGMKGHNGIDLLCKDREPVYAAHDGKVSKIYNRHNSSKTKGYGVYIKNGFTTVYWHLTRNVKVKLGQEVKDGQLIGFADNSGLYTTGTHLHFGLYPEKREYKNGYHGAIDPLPFISNNKNMRYVIDEQQEQYLLYDELKIALNIGDGKELEELKKKGLKSQPASVSNSYIEGYEIYPLVSKKRWGGVIKDFRDLSGF